jgi:hypothetical protein
MSKANFKLGYLNITIGGETKTFGDSHLLALTYHEDITLSNLRMSVTLTDTESGVLSQVFGFEPVQIKFFDSQDSKEANFVELNLVVYCVTDKMIIGGNKSKATLHLVSPDFVNNAAAKLSVPIKNKTPTEVVEYLLRTVLKTQFPLDADTSSNRLSFITNFWNPFTIINFMSDKALYTEKSGKSATAGFLFYETQTGYNWKAIDNLVKQEPKFRVVVGGDFSEEELQADKSLIQIDRINATETSDVLQGLNYGSYSARLITYDIGSRKVVDETYKAVDLYKDIPKLNESELPDYYSAVAAPTRIMTKALDSTLFLEGSYTKDANRLAFQSAFRGKMLFNKKVEFEYQGRMDAEIGDVVLLASYSGRDRILNVQDSGKYLIGKVDREWRTGRGTLVTKLTLYSDSLGSLTDEGKQNVLKGIFG